MEAPKDVYECLAETLDAQLRSAPGEPTEEAAQQSPELKPRRLEADRDVVRLHSQLNDQPVTYGQATFCMECGEPAPCGTIQDLSERYGCAGS